MTPAERNAVLEEAARVCDRGERGWAGCDPNCAEAVRICALAIRALKEQEPTTAEERRLRKQGSSKWGPQFPPSSCTSWEDCVNDGDCHDPNCGAPSQNGADEEPTT